MFEEEAEEYLGNFADCANCKERWSICADSLDEYCLVNGCCCAIPKEQDIYIAGAKLGYNKANEWHYPSKGELPENNKLCLIQMKTGTFEIAYRVTDLCWKYKNTTFSCSFQNEIYAWKEIVFSKEIKEK